MILGTWGAAYFTYHSGNNPWIGILGAALLGLIGGLLHAVATVTFGVDQIVSGVAINLIGLGATTYLAEATFPGLNGGGPRQLIGVAWEAERVATGEVGDNRLRNLMGVLPVPPLTAAMRPLMVAEPGGVVGEIAEDLPRQVHRDAADADRRAAVHRLPAA